MASARDMAKTGVLKGRGVPCFLAKNLRKKAGLATVHFDRYDCFRWFNMPSNNEDFFNRLHALSVAMELKGKGPLAFFVAKAANAKQAAGVLDCDLKSAKQIIKTLELPEHIRPIEGIISIEVNINEISAV